MICGNCGNSLAEGSASCPRCGTPVAGGAASVAGSQAFNFDAQRWSQAERITGAASVVLLISLFLPWFSISGNVLGEHISVSVSGTTAHGYLWLVFFLCLAVVAFLVLRAGFQTLPFTVPGGPEMVLLAATAINLLLVLIAFFVNSDAFAAGVGWSFGAFIGLLAAIAACVPLALPVLRARTARS
ncbi:MAG TPA: hypothetical protein VH641_03165 [Streptosporangiaceae bacterium]